MCDTIFAAPEITADKYGLFAKNSDRPPNEAQHLAWYPARSHQAGETLKCTYLEIPQMTETAAVLLSQPYWMWGAEMGLNEFGLVIGNEAVFSKIPANQEPALLGMDLLRLGLERARSADQALEVITGLLEQFGQGGNCDHQGHLYYHNSYLISDPGKTWVLETIDRHWAAREVSPLYSISNLLSLDKSWDRSSAGLREFALAEGLAKDGDRVNLTRDFSDLIYTTFADGGRRCQRSRSLLDEQRGQIRIQTMARILRDHRVHPDPTTGLAGADICMHAGLGPIRISQTTGSLIVSLQAHTPLAFATGTSAPCTGIFKPVWVDAPPGNLGPVPGSRFDPQTLFWSHELLHRSVLENYSQRVAVYQSERDDLEEEFIQGALRLREASREERQQYSEDCFQRASAASQRWLDAVRKVPPRRRYLHSLAWNGFNQASGFSRAD